MQRIAAVLRDILTDAQRDDLVQRTRPYAQPGVPEDLTVRLGRLKALSSSLDIVRIAAASGQQVEDVGAAYFLVGDRFRLDWLRRAAGTMKADNHWHRLALAAIIDDLWGHQNDLTSAVLCNGETGVAAVARWLESRAERMESLDQLLHDIESSTAPDLAMLAVANRQLRAVAAG